MSMTRYFITGGAGFVGSELVRTLAQTGTEILNVDKLTYAGNLQSLRSVERSPKYRFDRVAKFVFHNFPHLIPEYGSR